MLGTRSTVLCTTVYNNKINTILQHIIGDFLQVDDIMLAHMDELEKNGIIHTRDIIHIELIEDAAGNKIATEGVLECTAYFLKNYNLDFLQEEFREQYTADKYPPINITPDEKGIKEFFDNRHKLFRSQTTRL